jgi:hypothetical protein
MTTPAVYGKLCAPSLCFLVSLWETRLFFYATMWLKWLLFYLYNQKAIDFQSNLTQVIAAETSIPNNLLG